MFGGKGRLESLKDSTGAGRVGDLIEEMRKAKEEAEETIEETHRVEEEIRDVRAEAEQVAGFAGSFLNDWGGQE